MLSSIGGSPDILPPTFATMRPKDMISSAICSAGKVKPCDLVLIL
jgi:hypothetical protein